MEERLLLLLESVLGKSKKTSGDNYAFWSPFVNHHKPKLEINIKLNSNGDNPWHCWISDEKGKSRGITPVEIIKYQIGYCEEGVYKNKVIIPSYDENGMLNYFVGRSFYEGGLKHKNPDVSKDVVGFEMMVNWDLPITLCEGVFDAMAIRMNAIPLFGKSPQSVLQRKIIEKGVKKMYIALDSDAFKNALKLAETLMNDGVEVHIVEMGDSDPSELGFDKIYEKINNTEALTLRKLMEYKLLGV